MDASVQISRFEEFFDSNYGTELLEVARKGVGFIDIDFAKISEFDPDLADEVLERPEESFKAAQLSLEKFDISKLKQFCVRMKNLPRSQYIMIRNIRSNHLGQLLWFEGIVRQKSDVRPQVVSARFECPSCGQVHTVLQLEQKFREPTRCSCGRKGKFRQLSKELIDVQRIVLEEAAEDLEGGEQQKRMNFILKKDLVSPLTDKKTNPGSKIRITGVVNEVPIQLRTGGQSTRYDLMVESNHVEPLIEDYYDVVITPKEEAAIQEIAKDPKMYKKLIASIAPSIYGYDRIKEAILLQLAGGVMKIRDDGVRTRGDMHVLLIGDPGAAKSQILKRIAVVAPKARYVSGKGVSGAGLTASVVKDEFLGGWSLEAGALPLANKGFCMIDEMDKMTNEDRSAMHEALEQQTVSISKANIQATLRCETTVLAAANPKLGRFDPYDILAKQINLPPALINRFDLIFPIKDMPNRDKDEKMAKHILSLHKNPETDDVEIPTDLLRKYISYVRQKMSPTLTDAAIDEIKKYYVDMRNSGDEEDSVRAVPISARQLEALVRLAEASAKLRLSDKVTKKDARRSIDILHYCLSQIGIDPETGKIDMDRVSTGISASQRSKIGAVKELILELEGKIGKVIPIDDIVSLASEKGIDESEIDEMLEQLKRSGDLFEPRRGFVSRI